MTATLHLTPQLEIGHVSRVIAKYLDTLGDTNAPESADEWAAGHALEDLLRDEIDQHVNSDALTTPANALGYGVKFGIEATIAALTLPAPGLLEKIIALYSDLREMIEKDRKLSYPEGPQ